MKSSVSARIAVASVVASCLLGSTAWAAITQVTVSGTVPAKSDSRSALQKARPEALAAAKRNAWMVLRTRSELASDGAVDFGRDQDEQMIQQMDDICASDQVVDLDQTYDKKLGRLTFRFRFACDQQRLTAAVRNINRANNPGALAVRQYRASVVTFFLASEEVSVEEFAETVNRRERDSFGVSTRHQAASESSSDSRIKGAARAENGEDVRYSESSGRIAENVSTNANVKARLQTSRAAEASASSDSNVTLSRDQQSGGSRIRRSAEVTRRLSAPQGVDKAMTQVFRTSDYEVKTYDLIEDCGGPKREDIQSQLRALAPDENLELPSRTRRSVLDSARKCAAAPRFLVEGYAKIGAPLVDNATGNPRITVYASVAIYDVTTGALLSTTQEKPFVGIGRDEGEARSVALGDAGNAIAREALALLERAGA